VPTGVVLLVVLELVIYFGFAEQMIEKMGLSKTALLIFFALMILGSYIDIPISTNPLITINLGGAIIPVVLAFISWLKQIEQKKFLEQW